MITYRWAFAILILNMYTLLEMLKNRISDKNSDLVYNDVEVLHQVLYESLVPSVRKSLSKKGFSINQRINSSFDTEYKNKDITTNSLLSIQISLNTSSILRISKNEEWKISDVNATSNESYDIIVSRNIEIERIESSIRYCIKKSKNRKI
jgi:hypothetical protein